MNKLFLFLLFYSFLLPNLSLAEQEKKHVLFINSYHNGYKWSDGELEGVRSILDNSQFKVDLQIEYLDAKKFSYETISKELYILFKEKFKDETFDCIVISDNDALNFVNQYRQELFPGIPVVFCGINDLTEKDIEAGNITGVEEVFDFIATIDIAKKLFPQRDHLVVLTDSSTAGNTIRHQIQQLVKNQRTGLDVEYWIQISLEEAQQRVGKLPANTFLFIAPYYQEIAGRFYTSEEISQAISLHSSVPIFSSWQFMIGYGAVGGRVLSSVEHGKIAGRMALEILQGTKIKDIPIIREPSGIFLFDHKVMAKHKIDERLLPPNSTIINAPPSIYSISKELFWTIMVSFVLLFLAFVAMIVAMLERRKVQLKIIDQLAFQETLMDTIPQLISWKDPDGKYLGANRAFLDFFDIESVQDMVGKSTLEILSDKHYSSWSVAADNCVVEEKQEFRRVRKAVLRKDGSEAWIEVNKVPLLSQGGRMVGVLSTAENITKEQNLQKQLLQSQKMEAIGTLAGGIAHDFNNILTTIINSTELAIGDLEPGSQTEADLSRVLKAARRGARVVKQILSFSRPSRENFRPTDLRSVIQEVVHLLDASLPANISVHSDLIAGTEYYVLADPTQMHQAILNLCTNAFHALRRTGGNITIQLRHLEPEEAKASLVTSPTGRIIKLSVIDDGPGIPPDIIDKIFDPFFSTKSKTEGTGLGLAVVHGIVQSHQGIIRVYCSPHGGSTFEIFLPETEPDEENTAIDQSISSHQEARILFIEDDEDQLQLTPRLLKEEGFTVTALRDPAMAFDRASVFPRQFDMLITDFDMPGMSGTELAKRLPHLPVILVSGRDDARMAAKECANIIKVIIKPYDKNDLMQAIREVM